jgi:hypothetical protein
LMPASSSDHLLIKKLNALGNLSHEEEEALVGIIGPRRTVNAGADIVHDGSCPAFSTVLLDGFCCRYKLLRQGRRQILAFQIPGDLLDLYGYVLPKMDHAIGALTRCIVAPIPHTEIRRVTERFPNVGHALERLSCRWFHCSHLAHWGRPSHGSQPHCPPFMRAAPSPEGGRACHRDQVPAAGYSGRHS